MVKSVNSEIEMIFDAYVNCQYEKPIDNNKMLKRDTLTGAFYDERGNKFSCSMRFFGYLIGLHGFNGFPVVLKDYDFNNLQLKTMYRGFRDYDFGASYLTDFNYHIGIGNKTIGTYFTENKGDAETYTWSTNKDNTADPQRVVKVKLLSDNFINLKNLEILSNSIYNNRLDLIEECEDKRKIEELYSFCFHNFTDSNVSEFERINKVSFFNFITEDPVALGLYLGYDYIKKTYRGTNIEHNIVFNRGCVCVPKSVANKFLKNSDNYKDAVYNYIETLENIK